MKIIKKLIITLVILCLITCMAGEIAYADGENTVAEEEICEQLTEAEDTTDLPEEPVILQEDPADPQEDPADLQKQNGWVQDEEDHWYYYTDDVKAAGWLLLENTWYYFNAEGIMLTGWQKIDEKWYYLNPSGSMAVGWIKLNGTRYYLKDSGAMATGWLEIGGKQYFFKNSGTMAANEWVTGYWWVDSDGAWTYKYKGSWNKNSKGWWFGDTSGWYAKNNTYIIDGTSYTFDENGYLDDSFTFSANGNGAVLTRYSGTKSNVVIPDTVGLNNKMYPVTSIGEGAFRDNSRVVSIEMPDSIGVIGANAFRNCKKLTAISRKNKKEVYVFIGDSYGKGLYYGEEHPYSNWIYYVTRTLGIKEYYANPQSGMGFVAGNSVTVNGVDHSYYALLSGAGAPADKVTQVVIMGGYNDQSYGGDEISLYVQRACLKARTMYPNAVVSVGMYGASTVAYHQSQIEKVIDYYKQCTWYGCYYAEGMENVLKSNMAAYMTSDTIHPNDEGQRALGAAISSYLTDVLDLPAELTYIGENAFSGCSSVKRVINNSDAYIEGNAFSGCGIPSYPGGSIRSGWQKAGGKWHYIYDSGEMATGWKQIDGARYYFNVSGVMLTGWHMINNKWYYLRDSGAMAVGWEKISDVWYYFDGTGVMQTGWQTINGKQYYFKPSGAMAANEWVSGYWWLSANGAWEYKYKGTWYKDSKGWWFGDTSGWYAKNTTVIIDGKSYSFDSRGYMK